MCGNKSAGESEETLIFVCSRRGYVIKSSYINNGKCEVNMESQTYAIVDLETTGHSSKQGDRIIQLAIVFMKDWQVIDTYTTFVNPEQKIPIFIEDLTHISNEDVADAKPFHELAYDIYEKLQGTVFVAHNIDFDLPFLQAEFERCRLPKWQGKCLDTVELAKILYPTSYSYKLQDVATDLGIVHEQAHRADDDALATAYLLKACYEKLLLLPQHVIEQLHRRSFQVKTDLSSFLFEIIRLKRQKVQDETAYTMYRGIQLKQPSAIAATPSTRMLVYPETMEEKKTLFSHAFQQFEIRESQFQMMDAVWASLNKRHEVLVEASTGIGKTLAYLIPALIYSQQTGKKVAISTYTTHLQTQLLKEELPKAERILNITANATILQGMSHYIDLDRFSDFMAMKDESFDENFAKMQFITWLAETETGDLSELNLSGGGHLFLEKVRRTDTSKDTRRKGAVDFYLRAMNRCQKADLIVTNHAMVVADLQRQKPILKQIDGWIIDEAHQMIQAAMVREETVFNYRQWKYVFGQLGSMSHHSIEHAWFVEMRKVSHNERQLNECEMAYRKMVQLFERTLSDMTKKLNLPKNVTRSMKYTFSFENVQIEQPLLTKVSQQIDTFLSIANYVTEITLAQMDELAPSTKALVEDWQYVLTQLAEKNKEWQQLFLRSRRSDTMWLELDARSLPGSIQIMKKPISIKKTVMHVFNKFRDQMGIVWASGTLTAPKNPRFIAEQLGVSPSVPLYQFQAPKSYYEGAQVYVVEDMPDIQNVPQAIYIEHVAQAIVETVLATNGRCFVLFTSQDMLKKTVLLIQETEQLEQFMLFAQGVSSGSRMKLLKMFQKFDHSVLFGTNSFWEGVDVPGDALSAVIVVRLPFTSPDEPVFKAKADALQARGLNSFYKLSLPEAILRFKQGFGRLIRSSHDKGAFIVLDRRIETKSYGPQFIEALPNVRVEKVPLERMVLQLEDWYNEEA